MCRIAILWSVIAALGAVETIRFPADSGVIDVTRPPYNAAGDGVTDDTDAIERAVQAYPNGKVFIYFPAGTYLISDTIEWPQGRRGWEYKNVSLLGEHRDRSVIRLKDGAAGFGDPAAPKAMVWTGAGAAQRFGICLINLTLDAGSGNAGAIGAQYMSNNTGQMRDVLIRGDGAIGLDLAYTNENGPLLVKRLRVEGFGIGIRSGHGINSQTFEGVELSGQRAFGWLNTGQVVSVRRLRSDNAVPAFKTTGGTVTMLDCELRGTGPGPGILNEGRHPVLLRRVDIRGYDSAYRQFEVERDQQGEETARELVAEESRWTQQEFLSTPSVTIAGERSVGLDLPIEDTPEVPYGDPDTWVSVKRYGAEEHVIRDVDSGPAIQQAIDSGGRTVYVPNTAEQAYPRNRGGYSVAEGTVIQVRGAVERIIGCEAATAGHPNSRYWLRHTWVIGDGVSEVVAIEHLGIAGTIRIETDRTVVLRKVECDGVIASGGGEVFIEDCVGSYFEVSNGTRLWARQLNPEQVDRNKEQWHTHLLNDGGLLWVLGLKTEGGGTILTTRNGGRSEILGAHFYTTHSPDDNRDPMFVVSDGACSVFGAETQFAGTQRQRYVEETVDGTQLTVEREALPWNYGTGRIIPLYSTTRR